MKVSSARRCCEAGQTALTGQAACAPGTPEALRAAPSEIKRCELGSGSPDAPHALGHASQVLQPVNVRSPMSRSHWLPSSPGLKRRAASCHSDTRDPMAITVHRLANVAYGKLCCRNVPERSPNQGSAEQGSEPIWALGTRCGRGSPASLESHAAPAPALPPPPVPLPAGNAPVWVLITGHAGPGEVSSAEIGARSRPR
jgi:hypothetical protein